METKPKYAITIDPSYKRLPFVGLNAWTKGMRSGMYKQCPGQLCHLMDGVWEYCCLGLLSLIQGRLADNERDGKNSESSTYLNHNNPIFIGGKIKGNALHIPEGITVMYKNEFNGSQKALNFAALNDDARLSFEEIADIADACFYDPKTPQP